MEYKSYNELKQSGEPFTNLFANGVEISKFIVTKSGDVYRLDSTNTAFKTMPFGKLGRHKNGKGYFYMSFQYDGINYRLAYHRVAYESWNKTKIPKGQSINHLDCDKSNNDAMENLEVVSARENMLHSYKNNRHKNSVRHPFSVFKDETEVLLIRTMFLNMKLGFLPHKTNIQIAKEFGVSPKAISSIKNYITYKSLDFVQD